MKTELIKISNIQNGVATILLYDQIGSLMDEHGNFTPGINGTQVAEEIRYLNEIEKVDSINIRINSVGGSVLEGYSIVSAILNSKAPCNTYIDGLAASIAGVIAIAGKKCYMMDYGTLMLHNPAGASDDLLSFIKGTLVKIIFGRTKRSDEEIAFMMDAETWLSAADALKMGMIDEIISSAKEFKMEQSDRKNLFNLVKIYNKIIETPTNTNKMNTEEKAKLENEITEKTNEVISLTNTTKTLEEKISSLEKELVAFKEEKESKLKADAIELVENAIKDGKIAETSKDSFVEMAINNFEVVKNSIAGISTKKKEAVKIVDALVNVQKGERSNWTIRDFEKKDPKALTNIKKSNPDEYQRLFDEFYKSK